MGNPDSDSLKQQTESEKSFNSNDDSTKITNTSRESMINTAVKFLSDKKIQNQDPNLLRKFLVNKGLTEEEVVIAFQRLEKTKTKSPVGGNSLAVAQHFAPPLPPLPTPLRPSLWQTTHSIVTTITSIAGILYAVYWLWKTYIYPYLFGRRPKPKPIEKSLAEIESAVGACVADVKTIRSSVETLTAAEHTHGVLVTRVQEVKAEVNSLKGLLLNRNQFPAVPTPLASGPQSIPAWQLNADEAEQERETEEEGNGSNGNTNGSDSSLEIVKDPNN